MGCCNILTGYAPPHTPPSLNDFPLYIDRLHKEVWYWTGTGWEIVWQVSIATDTTAGMVKVSPTSPITIDAEGFLGIDCARLKAHCKFITQAELDAAINLLRTQFAAEISRIDASITSIKTSIGDILVRLGDIDKRITTLTTTVTDLSTRVSIIATDVTKLKSDVARLDDPTLTSRISMLFRDISVTSIHANAPHADVAATVYTSSLYSQENRITFATYPLSVQHGVWKQLPNSRESITLSFPGFQVSAPNWVIPNWVPNVSRRGIVWPISPEYHPEHITNVSARLIHGSTPAIDLPADYEAYLPELCATASCEVITLPDGATKLADTLDVTIVKHTSTPKGNIVVVIEFSPRVYLPSYLIPIVP